MLKYNYYVIDDFNEPVHYFDTYEAALNYVRGDKKRVFQFDLNKILGECLL